MSLFPYGPPTVDRRFAPPIGRNRIARPIEWEGGRHAPFDPRPARRLVDVRGVTGPGRAHPGWVGVRLRRRASSYPINGEVGDPAPAPGVEPLWDVTVVAPFIEVFGSLQEGIDTLASPMPTISIHSSSVVGCGSTTTATRRCASRTSRTRTGSPRSSGTSPTTTRRSRPRRRPPNSSA